VYEILIMVMVFWIISGVVSAVTGQRQRNSRKSPLPPTAGTGQGDDEPPVIFEHPPAARRFPQSPDSPPVSPAGFPSTPSHSRTPQFHRIPEGIGGSEGQPGREGSSGVEGAGSGEGTAGSEGTFSVEGWKERSGRQKGDTKMESIGSLDLQKPTTSSITRLLQRDEIADGIIIAEILGPPKAKRRT